MYQFREVTYYTIHLSNEEDSLGMQFIENHSDNEDIDLIRAWMKKMGTDRRAHKKFFRNEARRGSGTMALPPLIRMTHQECSLRWYCLPMNIASVIMFNGGIKTEQDPTDCSNVKKHFLQANRISHLIWEAFEEGYIQYDERDRLIFEEKFKLEI